MRRERKCCEIQNNNEEETTSQQFSSDGSTCQGNDTRQAFKKYINRFTLSFLKDFRYDSFVILNNKDLKVLRFTTRYIDLKYRINTNMKSCLKKPPIIELEELAFRFFSD